MNEEEVKHCAAYIMQKMQEVGVAGSDTEIHTSAKQFLAMIMKGEVNVAPAELAPPEVPVTPDASANGVSHDNDNVELPDGMC
ncbi:MAG: hypothetical protein QNI96_05040 [Woeseiaceae bacterium]|nr:hypothetical protein [Woeseiaceae bacterium]